MSELNLRASSPEHPRTFLAADADLSQWESIEPYFSSLLTKELNSAAQVEQCLSDLSELSAAVSQEASARYISMTCSTDDQILEKAYLDYVENVLPKTEPLYFELSKKYLTSPGRAQLKKDRYFVYDRARQSEVDLFRAENVALQTQDEVLAQQYQKACGEQTVEFDGKSLTLPQVYKILEETDRDRRRKAWIAGVERQLADREQMETFFDQMLALRQKMAENAGFPNYLEYQFRRLGRFDYSPADCVKFHESVEKVVVPIRNRLRRERAAHLGLKRLVPWDLSVDPKGRQPLLPFKTSEQLVAGTDKIFREVDPSFAEDFSILMANSLLDLDSRKGKAPGGYQSTLDEARLPFIFMNATGRNQDVFTLLHEGGHAFHALAYRDEPLHAYRNAPIEFCEVASMGMEMMACERLDAFYSSDDSERARQMHLEDIITLLPSIVRVDAHQHWMYTHPGHTRQERAAHWLELDKRFGEDLDWPELSEWRECSWIAKLHFFCVPLYYIEYGIAQLGALQLWVNYLKDPARAVQNYREALALGNSKPLPELFDAAGIRFAFDEGTIQPLMEQVASKLETA